MKAAAPYSIPPEPGRARAILLAVLVHGLLLAFLWIGVRWQNDTPESVEAEIWNPQAREAAPLAPTPPPSKAEPLPVVKELPKASNEPDAPEVPVQMPDIALEQRKKRKAEQLQKQLEVEREQKRDALAREQKIADDRTRREKQLQQLQQQQRQQQQQDESDALRKAELKKLDAAKKRKQEEADSKQLAKIHDEEMRRIAGGVAAPVTGSGGSGNAPKSQGPRADNGYVQKVGAKIKSNTVFNVPESLEGNPNVEFEVQLLPDGSLRGRPRKLKSSGLPGFDEAVLNAIEKSVPFPADKSGTAPAGFTVSHKPKD